MAKRILAGLLILALFIPFMPAALASDPPIAYGVVKNPNAADRLNLREAASTNAKSLGRYYNGTKVSIQSYHGDWAFVYIGMENGDITGYMQTKFLDTTNNQDNVPVVWPSYTHKGTLKLYDYGFGYVRETYTNPLVEVMGFSDSYWHVRIGGSGFTGFIKPGNKSIIEHSSQPSQGSQTIAVVNNPNPADRLHLREKASTTSESLGKFYNGFIVYVLDKNPTAKTWVQVEIGGKGGDFYAKGYMMTKYLAFGEAANRVISDFPQKELYGKNGGNVNVRAFYEGPTKDVLKSCPSGTQARIMGIHPDYLIVDAEGTWGIVSPTEIK